MRLGAACWPRRAGSRTPSSISTKFCGGAGAGERAVRSRRVLPEPRSLATGLADFNAVLRWLPGSRGRWRRGQRSIAGSRPGRRRRRLDQRHRAGSLRSPLAAAPLAVSAQLRRHDEARLDADAAVVLDPNELDYYTYRGSLLAERAGSEEDLSGRWPIFRQRRPSFLTGRSCKSPAPS